MQLAYTAAQAGRLLAALVTYHNGCCARLARHNARRAARVAALGRGVGYLAPGMHQLQPQDYDIQGQRHCIAQVRGTVPPAQVTPQLARLLAEYDKLLKGE